MISTRAPKELRDRVGGDGFTVLVEAPFVVVGDEAPKQVQAHRDRLPAPQRSR